MGTVHKFKRPPKNRGQFQGYNPKPPHDPRDPRKGGRGTGRRWWQWKWWGPLAVLTLAVVLGLLSAGR
ncbi:hypothetical protein [Novosphingobium sp. JCM 18896]|uniref:hypothetical protein n=1 Tax=Novosphingobium sp. JCM 18896 TaxID=2989731 RepID=UPI002223E8C7|nr:hypothetical protein [Novosphingobium sp. JCM 18896]MCW1431517.1 hypothetical protein [Novosphingobium sp. JCM 18896]